MDRIFSPRVWQVLGAVAILYGVYAVFSGDPAQSVIYFGGGSAMILLLGRSKGGKVDGSENGQ